MKLLFSDFFEISEDIVEVYGAFNISLVCDLPLFIDPFRIFNSDLKEYKILHEQIIKYLVFLRDKSIFEELEEGLIEDWYRFPEVKQNWFGYSKTSNNGSGLGPKFAKSLNRNFRILNRFGEETISKSHLEKLTLINDGVGRDNISDFTTNLIKEFLLNYSQSFARKYLAPKFRQIHAISKVRFNYDTESWVDELFELPNYENTIKDNYVLLTPVNLLTKDETWINRNDMLSRFQKVTNSISNEALKAKLNYFFRNKLSEIVPKEKEPAGKSRKSAKKDKEPAAKYKIQAANDAIEQYPEFLDYFVKYKEEHGYEAESVSSLKVVESKLLYLIQFSQLAKILTDTTDFYKISNVSFDSCFNKLNLLKDIVENGDGNEIFHFGGKPIEDEDNLSILFRMTWKADKRKTNSDIDTSAEIITTWKKSKTKLKIVLKLSTNTKIKQTFEKLRDVYNESLNEQEYILVIVHYTDEELNSIQYLLNSMGMGEHKNIIFINAGIDENFSEKKSIMQFTKTFENGYALLIGVGGGNIAITVEDATALRDILVDPNRAAYPTNQVKLLTEQSANRKSILDGFDELIQEANKNPDATVVIYYSGHGGRIENVGKPSEYFLVPSDFDSKNWKKTAIFGHEFINKIKSIKSKKMLILLDCCHAGGIPTPKNDSAKFVKSPAPPDLINVLSPGSGQIMIASSSENEFSYTDKPYSVFTTCLIEALSGKASSNKEGYAKIMDVMGYLLEEVPPRAKKRANGEQHPVISQINNLNANFPVCFFDGGKKQSAIINKSETVSITNSKRERLEKTHASLQNIWNIQNEKANRIRESVAVETNPANKYQYELELINAIKDLDKTIAEIEDIEIKLSEQ